MISRTKLTVLIVYWPTKLRQPALWLLREGGPRCHHIRRHLRLNGRHIRHRSKYVRDLRTMECRRNRHRIDRIVRPAAKIAVSPAGDICIFTISRDLCCRADKFAVSERIQAWTAFVVIVSDEVRLIYRSVLAISFPQSEVSMSRIRAIAQCHGLASPS